MSKIADEVSLYLTPIVQELGYEIVEVEFAKKYNGDNLTVFIDKKEGFINIDDCEKVHTAIDAPLDELDPTGGKPYTLNVSSPGADRPIVTNKDFERNIGETLEIKLFQSLNKKKVLVGKLLEFDDDALFIEDDKKTQTRVDRKLIAKATKFIDF